MRPYSEFGCGVNGLMRPRAGAGRCSRRGRAPSRGRCRSGPSAAARPNGRAAEDDVPVEGADADIEAGVRDLAVAAALLISRSSRPVRSGDGGDVLGGAARLRTSTGSSCSAARAMPRRSAASCVSPVTWTAAIRASGFRRSRCHQSTGQPYGAARAPAACRRRTPAMCARSAVAVGQVPGLTVLDARDARRRPRRAAGRTGCGHSRPARGNTTFRSCRPPRSRRPR